MKRLMLTFLLSAVLLSACATVNLEAPVPVFNTGIDPGAWVPIPAGSFTYGQFDELQTLDYDFEIMVTDVTVAQYVEFLNQALASDLITATEDAERIVGYYPGDAFHAARHEIEIPAGDYIIVPLGDPASRFTYDGVSFTVKTGWGNHPMTNVSWFGAAAYCDYYGWQLPSEMEWEKAARGNADNRPFPWGYEIERQNANFYASRDPFEDMSNFGSRTSPVGFYNGESYNGYNTLPSASPYGLYDMAGNVWQWTRDVYEGQHYRYLRGGSKDTYEMDLRVWVRNNAEPSYYSPGVGFRCERSE